MYHSKAIARWQGLTAQARENLGGFNSGIGFIGSAEWAIGGAMALGALERAVSSAKAKAGIQQLAQANELLVEMRTRACFVSFANIQNAKLPSPQLWCGQQDEVEFAMMDEEFLSFKTTSDNEVAVRWSSVITYYQNTDI